MDIYQHAQQSKSRFDTYTEAQRLGGELSRLSLSLGRIDQMEYAKEVMTMAEHLQTMYDIEVIEKAN